MKDMMKYKGYYGNIHYDPDEPIFYGRIAFIKALVSYEATDATGIKEAFKEAVDDYLQMCAQEKIEPEKPLKGSFNIRVGHKLHEKIALAAKEEDVSINQLISSVLEREFSENRRTTDT